jgi:hypothetical protein
MKLAIPRRLKIQSLAALGGCYWFFTIVFVAGMLLGQFVLWREVVLLKPYTARVVRLSKKDSRRASRDQFEILVGSGSDAFYSTIARGELEQALPGVGSPIGVNIPVACMPDGTRACATNPGEIRRMALLCAAAIPLTLFIGFLYTSGLKRMAAKFEAQRTRPLG